jgi:dTDP-4-amino-4,6-dideoxy-D-galactose acyltransferase
MEIKRLEWDSDFFGLRIGRAEINSAEEARTLSDQSASVKESFDLVYVVAPHNIGFLASNAKMVDAKVVYALSDSFCSEENQDVMLWDRTKGVTDDLLYLALVSGKYSRFKLDDGFPQGSFERLYSCWIEQSVNHTLATDVFCYMIDGIPRGLVTLDNNNGIGNIGLVAIHEDFQHRGIGTAMMLHVIHYATMKQCVKLSVATQLVNEPACRLYEKSGFAVESITDVWHWWL